MGNNLLSHILLIASVLYWIHAAYYYYYYYYLRSMYIEEPNGHKDQLGQDECGSTYMSPCLDD